MTVTECEQVKQCQQGYVDTYTQEAAEAQQTLQQNLDAQDALRDQIVAALAEQPPDLERAEQLGEALGELQEHAESQQYELDLASARLEAAQSVFGCWP